MNAESRQFIAWVIHPSHWVESLRWSGQKIKRRLHRKWYGHYSTRNYPPEVLKRLEAAFNAEPPIQTFSNRTDHAIAPVPPDRITLASMDLMVPDGFIDWHTSFADPEDEESLHRWNWLLQLASDEKSSNGRFLWAQLKLEEWIGKFQHEAQYSTRDLDRLLRWESYTVGERISNSVFLFYLGYLTPSVKLQKALITQTQILILRLEYFASGSFNHAFNNARAIYLAGVFWDCEPWRRFAEAVIRRELPRLVTPDGFLREGSSHYQFIFSRWVLEIEHFTGLCNDQSLTSFLRPITKKLLRQCAFFQINTDSTTIKMPLFGDISPDFRPEWLAGLGLAPDLVGRLSAPHSTWYGLLQKQDELKFILSGDRLSSYQTGGDFSFPDSGWYRFNFQDHTLLLRADYEGVPPYVGHHHWDAGHFCLYHQGIPVLADTGRLNYLENVGLSAQAHNSLTLDGLGSVPQNPSRYPIAYSNCRQWVRFHRTDDVLEVVFESDGFSRFGRDLFWRRIIRLFPNQVRIIDDLKGHGLHTVHRWFHWDATAVVSQIEENTFCIQCPHAEASLRLSPGYTQTAILHYCGEAPFRMAVSRLWPSGACTHTRGRWEGQTAFNP